MSSFTPAAVRAAVFGWQNIIWLFSEEIWKCFHVTLQGLLLCGAKQLVYFRLYVQQFELCKKAETLKVHPLLMWVWGLAKVLSVWWLPTRKQSQVWHVVQENLSPLKGSHLVPLRASSFEKCSSYCIQFFWYFFLPDIKKEHPKKPTYAEVSQNVKTRCHSWDFPH